MKTMEKEKQYLQEFISLSFDKIAKPYEDNSQGLLGSRGFYALYVLAAYGSMTMTEFGVRANMKKQQTTKVVDKLVELRFAERTYDKKDRRTIWIQVTATGKQFLEDSNTYSVDSLIGMMRTLKIEGQDEFFAALKIVNSVLVQLQKLPPKDKNN